MSRKPAALTEETKKALVDAALKSRKRAYAPYSRYNVGAALLTSDGTIVTGTSSPFAAWRSATQCRFVYF